jgi:hypothetical protein
MEKYTVNDVKNLELNRRTFYQIRLETEVSKLEAIVLERLKMVQDMSPREVHRDVIFE